MGFFGRLPRLGYLLRLCIISIFYALGGLLVHGLGRVAELLDIGQDLRALGGEHHAELAAVQPASSAARPPGS